MFRLQRYLVLSIFVLSLGIFMGCSDSDGFDAEQLETDTFESYATVLSSDFDRLEASGISIHSIDGVFSIGWNQFFNPMMNDTVTHGHAFAVAFDDANSQGPLPIRNGIDMGSIFINYQNNHIELQKTVSPIGGILYSLFPRPNIGDALEFIPGATYEFEVTGSSNFSPINFTVTAPSALLDFTSHANGDLIDPNNDLTLIWNGGTANDPVGIHIMPKIRLGPIFVGNGVNQLPGGDFGNRGPVFGNQHPGMVRHPLPLPMPIHMGIFEVLPDNPGQYTIAAADLQNLLSNSDTTGIMCHISQMNVTEIDHEGRMLGAIMRNGDRLMLNTQ